MASRATKHRVFDAFPARYAAVVTGAIGIRPVVQVSTKLWVVPGSPSEDRDLRGMALADDIRAKIEAGQGATATPLRTLAGQIERLPLSNAAEVLNWISPHLERLQRAAELSETRRWSW